MTKLKANQRACIASIVIALSTNKEISSVYSYELSKYIMLSGSANNQDVQLYDYSRSCYLIGSGDSHGSFSLFDYGENKFITLNIKSDQFYGYDFGSKYHFSGTINNNSISLYDFKTKKFYSFSC